MDYRDIPPGLSWPDAIRKAITQSSIIVKIGLAPFYPPGPFEAHQ
jgi:hypothetical protein